MSEESKVEDFGANSSAGEHFKSFKPVFESVEAAQVTPAFLQSLPRGGKNIQRFGNQAEVYGSNGVKGYAQEMDFVVRLGGDYFVVTPKVFNALFEKLPEAVVDAKAAAEAPTEGAPVSTPADDGRPLTITEAPLDSEPAAPVQPVVPAHVEVDPLSGEEVVVDDNAQTKEEDESRN